MGMLYNQDDYADDEVSEVDETIERVLVEAFGPDWRKDVDIPRTKFDARQERNLTKEQQ